MRFADQHYCTIGGIFCLLEAKATGNSPAQQVVSFCADTIKSSSNFSDEDLCCSYIVVPPNFNIRFYYNIQLFWLYIANARYSHPYE